MSRTFRRAIQTRNPRYRQLKANPEDAGKTIAYIALAGVAGYGLYIWWKGKEEEPPPDGIIYNECQVISNLVLTPSELIEYMEQQVISNLTISPTVIVQYTEQQVISNLRITSSALIGYIEQQRISNLLIRSSEEKTYTLIIDIYPSISIGWVDREPDRPAYGYDEEVTLTAILDPHHYTDYRFSHWLMDGIATYYMNPITILMTTNHELVAYFVER